MGKKKKKTKVAEASSTAVVVNQSSKSTRSNAKSNCPNAKSLNAFIRCAVKENINCERTPILRDDLPVSNTQQTPNLPVRKHKEVIKNVKGKDRNSESRKASTGMKCTSEMSSAVDVLSSKLPKPRSRKRKNKKKNLDPLPHQSQATQPHQPQPEATLKVPSPHPPQPEATLKVPSPHPPQPEATLKVPSWFFTQNSVSKVYTTISAQATSIQTAGLCVLTESNQKCVIVKYYSVPHSSSESNTIEMQYLNIKFALETFRQDIKGSHLEILTYNMQTASKLNDEKRSLVSRFNVKSVRFIFCERASVNGRYGLQDLSNDLATGEVINLKYSLSRVCHSVKTVVNVSSVAALFVKRIYQNPLRESKRVASKKIRNQYPLKKSKPSASKRIKWRKANSNMIRVLCGKQNLLIVEDVTVEEISVSSEAEHNGDLELLKNDECQVKPKPVHSQESYFCYLSQKWNLPQYSADEQDIQITLLPISDCILSIDGQKKKKPVQDYKTIITTGKRRGIRVKSQSKPTGNIEDCASKTCSSLALRELFPRIRKKQKQKAKSRNKEKNRYSLRFAWRGIKTYVNINSTSSVLVRQIYGNLSEIMSSPLECSESNLDLSSPMVVISSDPSHDESFDESSWLELVELQSEKKTGKTPATNEEWFIINPLPPMFPCAFEENQKKQNSDLNRQILHPHVSSTSVQPAAQSHLTDSTDVCISKTVADIEILVKALTKYF